MPWSAPCSMPSTDASRPSSSDDAFSAGLVEMRQGRDPAGSGGSDVPCGTCTACCTSSQFVHIEPDERDALAHIPAELLFPAPGRPRGHVLLGYDERGHCPMLVDGACSIYAHRPRTCRTYDCRVFAAAGVDPGDGQAPDRQPGPHLAVRLPDRRRPGSARGRTSCGEVSGRAPRRASGRRPGAQRHPARRAGDRDA